MQRIGIMAALHDEVANLLEQMESVATRRIGMRDYHVGELNGSPCVIVLARIGKVAAAATAVTLIREFSVDRVIFTGLAGGVARHTRIGDVVIGTALLQHDLDARPLFPRYEIPLLGQGRISADASLVAALARSTQRYFEHDWQQAIPLDIRETFGLGAPQMHVGLIVSGDQFVCGASTVQALRVALPDALCVEMEGAAVAQVCHEYGARFAVVRIVSDRADHTAGHDFSDFLSQAASHYSAGILQWFLQDEAGLAPGESAGGIDEKGLNPA